MKLDGYSQQFAANHPEAGEISTGAVLSAEQMKALGEVFSHKITQLSRKRELAPPEVRFQIGLPI